MTICLVEFPACYSFSPDNHARRLCLAIGLSLQSIIFVYQQHGTVLIHFRSTETIPEIFPQCLASFCPPAGKKDVHTMPTPKIIKLFVYIIIKAYLKAMQSHTCLASQSLRAVTIFHSFSSSSAGHTPQFILMCQRQCSS